MRVEEISYESKGSTTRKTLKEEYTYKRFNERKEIIGIEEYK